MSKVVVTGGAGFIGSHLARTLVKEGHDVHIIDVTSTPPLPEWKIPGATYHIADVRNRAQLAPLFEGTEWVFHLAALPRVQYSIEHPVETHEVNVDGTLAVLDTAHAAHVKRVVITSSGSVYGDTDIVPIAEDAPIMPKSPYALHKYISELYGRVYADVYGLSTVSLRPFNIYGPHSDPRGPYALVVGKFIEQRREGKPLVMFGEGTTTRDYVHVEDLARAYLLAATSGKVGKGEAINIGGGKEISVREIAALVGGEVEHLPARLEPARACADITLAQELLGWQPSIVFADGVEALKKEAGIV